MTKQHDNKFWLIQEGSIISQKVIDLADMKTEDFSFLALKNSQRRIFYNFKKYRIYSTGIKNPDEHQLLLYCNKDQYERIHTLINEYMEHPYTLDSFCHLHHVPHGKNGNAKFWWCIDKHNGLGDWMLFFESDSNDILSDIKSEYYRHWSALSKEEQEELYKNACSA